MTEKKKGEVVRPNRWQQAEKIDQHVDAKPLDDEDTLEAIRALRAAYRAVRSGKVHSICITAPMTQIPNVLFFEVGVASDPLRMIGALQFQSHWLNTLTIEGMYPTEWEEE